MVESIAIYGIVMMFIIEYRRIILLSFLLSILTVTVIVTIATSYVEARNFSQVEEALSNGNFFLSASEIAVEKVSCLFALDQCVIQPTFGNENRFFQPNVQAGQSYNLTLQYIDETKANFTISPQVNNARIEINGTQLLTVTLDFYHDLQNQY